MKFTYDYIMQLSLIKTIIQTIQIQNNVFCVLFNRVGSCHVCLFILFAFLLVDVLTYTIRWTVGGKTRILIGLYAELLNTFVVKLTQTNNYCNECTTDTSIYIV